MQLVKAWGTIQQVFAQAQASTMHCSIASVNEQGQPHITPIGTVFLRNDQTGYFFDTYTKQLAKNVENNPRVCIMAVNASKGFWLKSLVLGKFATLPAMRWYGEISELRPATKAEIVAVQQRIKVLKWTKGSRLIWSDFSHVRDIQFTEAHAIEYPHMMPESF
ncbi:pyridoxamine 5'-phosphate oxidase family protein [Alkanindiges sp. WGS2144]|uniref:pyridoxamine 5'-phosphate oxidase family protein n=1 Tax=Alkanindiges sp. WGS2144 TaxID=3366808 RepID=UPI003751B856